MIAVTRLDNSIMMVNAANIQCLQATPDTVITFTNNMKMLVREPLEEISKKIVQYQQTVLNREGTTAC